MSNLKAKFFSPVWYFWNKILVNSKKDIGSGQSYVVLGFQRGGTSLMSRLVQGAGVSFGSMRGQKRVDSRNPYGFFEYVKILKLEDRLLKQAGFDIPRNFSIEKTFNAKGFICRIGRFFDRLKLVKHLSNLARSGDKWGLKIFAQNMFFWKQYLIKPKVIAIYRHPVTNAHSIIKAFNKHSFHQAIEYWLQNMQEILYYIHQYDSILIKYEDLLDGNRQTEVLQKMVDFLGCGDVEKLKGLIDTNITEHNEIIGLIDNYSLDDKTKKVLEALDKFRV